MLALLALFALSSAAAMDVDEWDPIKYQLLDFKKNTTGPIGTLTTLGGTPVSLSEATNTLNIRSLLLNDYAREKLLQLAVERIPERVVHAKGTGAFGHFEVTHDVSDICKANFLSKIGKRTPIAVRLSSTRGSRGGSDLNRDTRGFAIKFYTEEGNLDLVMFNTKVFNIKDPVNFDAFVHTANRNPATFFPDASAVWDISTLVPESMFATLLLNSDLGIPASYANMPGFTIHTYQVVNKFGVNYYVRGTCDPDEGVKNLFSAEARNISSFDPDYLSRDLYLRIARAKKGEGNYPSWTFKVQILSESDVKRIGPSVFDVTRVIPTKEFPWHPVGKIVLTENYDNFFAQVEQMAFCPSSLVPGILGAPDELFLARKLAYVHTQMYRLGGNFKKIAVNCPFQAKTHTYVRDGVPPVGDNEKGAPNYYPNSFHGAEPYKEKYYSKLIDIEESSRPNNFDQAAEYYNELSPEEQTRVIENIAEGLTPVIPGIKKRALKVLSAIHPEIGERLAEKMNIKSYS